MLSYSSPPPDLSRSSPPPYPPNFKCFLKKKNNQKSNTITKYPKLRKIHHPKRKKKTNQNRAHAHTQKSCIVHCMLVSYS